MHVHAYPSGVPTPFASALEWARERRRALSLFGMALLLGGGLLTAGWGALRHFSEEEQLYREYYSYYYGHLSKRRPEADAARLADSYARHYARYYTSDAYRHSLASRLPEADPRSLAYPADSPNAALSTCSHGIELVKGFESYRAEPYLDSGGLLTIGYGHLVRKHHPIASLTREQAETLLAQDLRVAEAVVKRLVKVKLSQEQFSALVSLIYNIGPSAFAESTLLKRLNQGKLDAASREFLRWKYVDSKHSKGLLRRRVAEEALFKASSRA